MNLSEAKIIYLCVLRASRYSVNVDGVDLNSAF